MDEWNEIGEPEVWDDPHYEPSDIDLERARETMMDWRHDIIEEYRQEIVQLAHAAAPLVVDTSEEGAVRHYATKVEALSTPTQWNFLKAAMSLDDAIVGERPMKVQWKLTEVELELSAMGPHGQDIDFTEAFLVFLAHLDRRELPSEPAIRHIARQPSLRDVFRLAIDLPMPGGDVGKYVPDLVHVEWRSILGVDGTPDLHLNESLGIMAVAAVLADEAEERLWIEVPWWRTDNTSPAEVLHRTCAAAERGVDVRVITRSPTSRNLWQPHLQREVISRLMAAGADVYLDDTTHRKEIVADRALLASSSNLTNSDMWLGNGGVLMVGTVAAKSQAQAMAERLRIHAGLAEL